MKSLIWNIYLSWHRPLISYVNIVHILHAVEGKIPEYLHLGDRKVLVCYVAQWINWIWFGFSRFLLYQKWYSTCINWPTNRQVHHKLFPLFQKESIFFFKKEVGQNNRVVPLLKWKLYYLCILLNWCIHLCLCQYPPLFPTDQQKKHVLI